MITGITQIVARYIALPLTASVSSSRRENIALLPEEGKCLAWSSGAPNDVVVSCQAGMSLASALLAANQIAVINTEEIEGRSCCKMH